MPVSIALAVLGAYLLGSVPFALLISRVFFRIDIREHGSGNVGATNVVRVLGKGPGIACFVLDFLKGAVPVWVGSTLGFPWWGLLLLGVASILGHSKSVFLRFTGGKSVATGAGVVVALSPWVGLAALAVWAVVFAVSRIVSLGSIVAAASLPLWMVVFHQPVPYVGFAA
ncbi:MAG TPA: glycerol-3-phosphate 1-O-acyltransferase PlsY, partial [Stenomitos sp.]